MNRTRDQGLAEPSSTEPSNHGSASISRRKFIKTGATAVAAGALLGSERASPRPVLSRSGMSARKPAHWRSLARLTISSSRNSGRSGGGHHGRRRSRPVEVLLRDSQSSPNRAAELAASLIKADKIDLMLVAGTPDTVNPVSDQCEINGVPCVSTDAPWQGYFFGRNGNPQKGFEWTYHFFFGIETLSQVFVNIFSALPTNKIVGALWPNDVEGNLFSDRKNGFPPVFEAAGFRVADPGRFDVATMDYSAQIASLKESNAEILTGIIPTPAFTTFWGQAAQQAYRPKIVSMGKCLLFPAAVNTLGARAKNLSSDVWWSPYHPFKSGLTGQTSAQYCELYEATEKKQWTMPLGFRHALFEVAVDVFKRTKDVDSPQSIIEAVRTTKYSSIVGPIQWQGPPPNQSTKNPVKNVCTTPEVGGQWVPGKKWQYDLIVVANQTYPEIPVQRKLAPMEYM